MSRDLVSLGIAPGLLAPQIRAMREAEMARVNQILSLAILDFWGRVKVRSPVDTGLFRNSWDLGVDQIPTAVNFTADKSGSAADGRILAKIADGVAGHRIFLANNLPYGRRLEYGFTGTDSLGRTYAQPGRGFLGLTVTEWPQILANATAAVG